MKYRVTIPYACFVTVEVEADNAEAAKEAAFEAAWISGYVGNGGSGKLIGVYGSNVSIAAGEEHIGDFEGFSIEVEEV